MAVIQPVSEERGELHLLLLRCSAKMQTKGSIGAVYQY